MNKNKFINFFIVPKDLAVGFLLMLGLSCAKSDQVTQNKRKALAAQPDSMKGTGSATGEKILSLTDQELVTFIKTECADCHTTGDDKVPRGKYASFWGFDHNNYGKEKILIDSNSALVYQTLVNRLAQDVASPSPMPPKSSQTDLEKLVRAVNWYKTNAPRITSEAHMRFPHIPVSTANEVKIDFQFTCSKPATFRTYLTRVTNDAFDRNPTDIELKLVEKADEPTTEAMRSMIGNRLKMEWRDEFIEKGLRKIARKISGASDISYKSAPIADSKKDLIITEALQDEFYQLVKLFYSEKSFKDIILSDSVMITQATAPLYGRNVTGTIPRWELARLEQPRSNYFSTVGFLASKPTSFLSPNNNYGRMAVLYFLINGQTLEAATNGPVGESVLQIDPCLKSQDRRFIKNDDGSIAPFGTMAIPEYGNICQSCHVNRHLAAGSMLFRPFDSLGDILTMNNVESNPQFIAALENKKLFYYTEPGEKNGQMVEREFLKGLFSKESEKSCLISPSGNKEITNIDGLVKELIGDGKTLSRGLARHMARGFSNLNTISLEQLEKTVKAYEDSQGMLEPVFSSYFTTETYACENKERPAP